MTRLNALDAKAAGSDAFGLTNYNKLKADVEYLTVAGADIASAATINPTAEFHGVTGTTTIDTITDAVGAVAGQQVRLWIKAGPLTIRNNGGGTGNIRTSTGLDRIVAPNEIVEFVYDGTVWREKARGAELSYTEVTAGTSVTATSGATATPFITAPSLTFDGATPIIAEFSGRFQAVTGADAGVYGVLYEDSAQRAEVAALQANTISSYITATVYGTIRFTPTAGAKVYSIRLYRSVTNGNANAGTGTGGAVAPSFLRIRRAA